MPNIPKFKHPKPYILILGGYGYANVGDEAQLNVTIKDLNKCFPRHDLFILTPNIQYTEKEHQCKAFFAPRVSFFDHDISDYYWLQTRKSKYTFIFRMFKIYFSVLSDKLNIPLIKPTQKQTQLLSQIKGADLLYFSGGGYLTGKTLSRLWDGCLTICISKLYETPIVLSGQTVGLFRNWFDRSLAKFAFRKVDLLTVRDQDESIKALENIKINPSLYYSTFDDALFCDKYSQNKIEYKYISLQIHFWSLDNNHSAQRELLNYINTIITFMVNETGYNVVLFGMHETDYIAIDEYLRIHDSKFVCKYGSDSDFRNIRSLISNSEVCVTMKHHPIIFALGENVPVISLAYNEYYEHKNIGALKLFGLESCNVTITRDFDQKTFKIIFRDLLESENKSVSHKQILKHLKSKREKFLKDVIRVLS